MLSAMETMMKAHPAAREKVGTLSAMETMMKALPRRGREKKFTVWAMRAECLHADLKQSADPGNRWQT